MIKFYIYILFQIISSYRLLQNIEYSSPCCPVGYLLKLYIFAFFLFLSLLLCLWSSESERNVKKKKKLLKIQVVQGGRKGSRKRSICLSLSPLAKGNELQP